METLLLVLFVLALFFGAGYGPVALLGAVEGRANRVVLMPLAGFSYFLLVTHLLAAFGLIGKARSGLLGMSGAAEDDSRTLANWRSFLLLLIPTGALPLYTVVKSRRLSKFLEKLADERASSGAKLAAFVSVWKTKHGRNL